LAIRPKIIEIIPPIRNLVPMILNPSPSSWSEITLAPIHIQKMPNATSIIPATIKGLKRVVGSRIDFDISKEYLPIS